MSLKDDVASESATDELIAVERKLLRAQTVSEDRKKELDRVNRLLSSTLSELDRYKQIADFVDAVSAAQPKLPKWIGPKKQYKKNVATPTLMLSDLHFDEVVRPEEIMGWNEYNREIAVARLERTINKTVEVCNRYVAGLDFEGFVLALGGDILTGDIHEELAMTNEGTVMQSVVFWVSQLASAIEYLANEFGRVFVPAVRGNHDRYSKKKQAKKQSQEAFTWIIYHWLQDHFRQDSRIEFAIAESPDLSFNIYDTRFLLTHGDQFRGGNGIAGPLTAIMRGFQKKHQRNSSLDQGFDVMILGHFHQYLTTKNIVMNGSLIGMNEYAFDNNFSYEPPQQALWINTPERGITMHTSIYAE